jgi:hypothetical protein
MFTISHFLVLGVVLADEAVWKATHQCEMERVGRFGAENLKVNRIPELSTTVVTWEIAQRLFVEIRDPKPEKEILCDSMKYIFNNNKIRTLPFYLKWNREDVLKRLKHIEPLADCPELHMSINQREGSLTIDCFFRNRGDIIVRFPGYDSRCLATVDLDLIDSICDSFMDFIDSFLKSSVQRKMETHPANFIGNLASEYLMKMRRSMKGRAGETKSTGGKHPLGFGDDSSEDEW